MKRIMKMGLIIGIIGLILILIQVLVNGYVDFKIKDILYLGLYFQPERLLINFNGYLGSWYNSLLQITFMISPIMGVAIGMIGSPDMGFIGLGILDFAITIVLRAPGIMEPTIDDITIIQIPIFPIVLLIIIGLILYKKGFKISLKR